MQVNEQVPDSGLTPEEQMAQQSAEAQQTAAVEEDENGVILEEDQGVEPDVPEGSETATDAADVSPEADPDGEGYATTESMSGSDLEDTLNQVGIDTEVTDADGNTSSILEYDGSYTNGIARALDNMSRVFGDGPIGQVLQKLAAAVESKFGDIEEAAANSDGASQMTQDMRDEITMEIMSDGTTASDPHAAADAALDAANMTPEAFVEDLNAYAAAVTEEQASGEPAAQSESDGTAVPEGSVTAQMADTIDVNAGVTPVETADALQMFNEVAVAKIDKAYPAGSPEHVEAMKSLETVMPVMTESLYEKTMEQEAAGITLTDDQKEAMDGLDVAGVNVSYTSYVPGDDVTDGKTAAQTRSAEAAHEQVITEGIESVEGTMLAKSDGSMFEDMTEEEAASVGNMRAGARQMVITGGMLDSGKGMEGPNFDRVHTDFRIKARDLHEERYNNSLLNGDTPEGQALTNSMTAESYMSMMRGIQAYNDEAVDAIRLQYPDDEAARQQATEGLARTMRAMAGDAFELMQSDDSVYKFLSEEDKAALDNMSFTGVNVKYSEYVPGMDLETGLLDGERPVQEMSLEDMADPDRAYGTDDMMYAGTGSWDSPEVTEPVANAGSVFVEEEGRQAAARTLQDAPLSKGEQKQQKQTSVPLDRNALLERLKSANENSFRSPSKQDDGFGLDR